MNPHHNSNQNRATASQVNQVVNQQMCNGNVGGYNMPIVAPSCFMNFPNQPFPMQNTPQFPNGFNPQQNFTPFPVNQFNPSQQQLQLQQQQQQGQFFGPNSMNPTAYNQNVGQQALLQNTIQNIYQLLQLQNPNNAQRPPAMFQNQIPNGMSNQTSGFIPNQQFVMPNSNGPVQHVNQGQPNMGPQVQQNPFFPGSVQTHQPQNLIPTLPNFQNQITQGVGPQNPNFPANQLFGMPGPVQHVNQGQQRFVSPMMDANASGQVVNAGQTQNLGPSHTNIENNHGNGPTNANGRWTDSQNKNFTGHKRNDASHKGFKSQVHHGKHAKEKFGAYNGNMNKEGNNNAFVDSSPQISTNFQKKLPSLNYSEQEIKKWREARKKNYPTSATVEKECQKEQTLSDVANQEAVLRCQQMKEILAKQAELGCEVEEVPPSYICSPDKQNPRDRDRDRDRDNNKKHQREGYKKEKKFNKKRGKRVKDNRMTKRKRGREDQDSFKRDPSLLEKLLTRDIRRDKNHILQVLRFITVNSCFKGEIDGLKFPCVVVGETNSQELTFKVSEKVEEEEGEITD